MITLEEDLKVLITADIHIGQYSDFNYKVNSRINQFDLLAKRLVELGKENGCKELWILGDFLRVPNARSKVQHKLKKFIKTLCSGFETVRYTLGNHDTDSKSDSQELDDTVVSIFEADNLIYMDKQLAICGNTKLAFANWTPSQDLTWYDDKVDILLGHYTKSDLFGQEIDEDKFDLMIHGDIHNNQVIGKFVSVGNPIQHDYSSQAEGTCIVLEPATKAWKHISVDEDKTRFLRLYYTDEASLEGFRGPLVYYKYRPPIQKELSDTGTKTISWSDVDDLLVKLTNEDNLTDIHGEIITTCNNFEEVDFNLQLISLDIFGYRSIVKFHLDFNRNERVVLLGDNGSGKSSIIRALRGVFGRSSDLSYDKSDLTDELSIKLVFQYQNKLVELTKGDTNLLVIDGEEQKYNNKRAFEADIIERFPFTRFLDIFFISSGTSNLSNQLSSDRRIELISKFYRLDRIAAYSSYADERYQEEWKKTEDKRRELDGKCSVLSHIKTRLSELTDIDIETLSDINARLIELGDLRRSYDEYKDWELAYNPLLTKRSELERSIKTFELRLTIDPRTTEIRIEELQVELSKLENLLESSVTRNNELQHLKKLHSDQLSRGLELKSIIEQLESGTCPECGSIIKGEKIKDLLDKYNSEIIEVRNNYEATEDKLSKYTEDELKDKYFITLISRTKERIKSARDEMMMLSNKLTQYKLAKTDIEDHRRRLDELNKEIQLKKESEPIRVTLPINLDNELETLRSSKSKIESKLKELEEEYRIQSEVQELEQEIIKLDEIANRYYQYSDLMSRTGKVMEEILKQLAEKFSSNEVKYEVTSGVYRGNNYIDFNTYYKVRGKWRVYNTLSDGQKQVCDLDFLNRLFSVRVGMLVLDEYFRHLDDKNFPKCIELLMKMNVDTLILSTHDPNLSMYTKRILLELNEFGETISKIL